MDLQIPSRLGHADPALPDQSDRLNLEFSRKHSPSHGPPPVSSNTFSRCPRNRQQAIPAYAAQYEERKIVNFSQANREKFLIGMIKVNFLKRLESSVHAFAITMERTVTKIEQLEARLRAYKTVLSTGC